MCKIHYALTDFVPKINIFENRSRAYLNVREQRKRKKDLFAGQKTKMNNVSDGAVAERLKATVC